MQGMKAGTYIHIRLKERLSIVSFIYGLSERLRKLLRERLS